MESNQDSRPLSRFSKRVKRRTTDSKLVNFDIVRAKRAEMFNWQLNSINFSDSEEEINPSPHKKRYTEIGVKEGEKSFWLDVNWGSLYRIRLLKRWKSSC